jgi:hypothetical protein
MLFRFAAMAVLLFSFSAFAQPVSVTHDEEDVASPGVIRLHGVTTKDSVLLDGELVHAEGLARARYNLLVAPGTYILSIWLAGSDRICNSRVTVKPQEVVTARCLRNVTTDKAAD